MPIKSIEISNVMVFRNQVSDNESKGKTSLPKDCKIDGFKLPFCDKINVLIGENGVGKTTILKMIYTAAQCSQKSEAYRGSTSLRQYFSKSLNKSEALKSSKNAKYDSFYRIVADEYIFEECFSDNEHIRENKIGESEIHAVYIPATEMLSHSKGFLAMNQKYNMPFDGTQCDIIMNASLPETKEISDTMRVLLDKIGEAIEGTVVQEDDIFYVLKNDGRKIEFSLEAEGLRKLGLIWKLVRNGLLDKNSVLLWDEPEANLNPELYPLVAEILLALQKNCVQIFVATHNYNFAKYLEIRREKDEQVLFHNLYKETECGICCQSANFLRELYPNYIMIADNKLLDEVYGG